MDNLTTAQYFVIPLLAVVALGLAFAGPIGKRVAKMRLKAQRRQKLHELARWRRG